jgi:tetratricopeptide (TPR) repeat protein
MGRLWFALILLAALAGCGGESAEKYLEQGIKEFQNQNYDGAIASYEKAIKLEPRAAAAYNLLGMAYRFKYNQLGKPELREKEIAAFKKAAEIDPKFWTAMINLGATYYAMGEKAQAASWFKKGLEINPNHPEQPQLEKMIAEGEKRS